MRFVTPVRSIPVSISTFLSIVVIFVAVPLQLDYECGKKTKKPAKVMISLTKSQRKRNRELRGDTSNRKIIFFAFSTLLYCRDEQKELRAHSLMKKRKKVMKVVESFFLLHVISGAVGAHARKKEIQDEKKPYFWT